MSGRALRVSMTRMTRSLRMVILAAAVLASAARGENPALAPAPAPGAQTAAEAEWGPPNGGLVVSLSQEGAAMVGGKLLLTIALRSAAGQPVALPPAKDAFGWVLVVQSLGGNRRGFLTEKVPVARACADWPAELAGEKGLRSKPIDISTFVAYSSDAGKELLLAYLGGKDGAALPRAAGKVSEVLSAGPWMARFTLCLPVPGAKPVTVVSNSVQLALAPPNLEALAPEARQAFVADLLKEFDRNAWSGKQAHDAAVRVGKELLPALIPAAFEDKRPPHARLWLATTLADIRDERATDALIKLLDDPAAGVRNVVAYHGVKQQSPRLDKALIDKVRASQDPGLATWTLMGFMVFRASVPEEVLQAGLESQNPQARAQAAEVLARHAGDESTARLAALLADRNERVRSTAAAMLGKTNVKTPAVIGGLVRALDLPGESARQRIGSALSELTGQNLPYDPKADQAARDKTLAAWKDWWAKKSEK